MVIITRQDLIKRIQEWLSHPDITWKGEVTLARYLHAFFSTRVTEDYGLGISIMQLMPEYLVEAMELLRTSDDNEVAAFRSEYLQELEYPVFPNLTEVGFGGLDRNQIVMMLSFIMGKLDDRWIEEKILGYFFAQDRVLDHALHRFNSHVFRQGMWQQTEDCQTHGMSGQFGSTKLRTYYIAGRIMITFARKRDGFSDGEESVTFVADSSDQSGMRTGLQTCFADLQTAVAMIEEVVGLWPKTLKDQQKVYKSDQEVAIG